jgi:hypothetical protein
MPVFPDILALTQVAASVRRTGTTGRYEKEIPTRPGVPSGDGMPCAEQSGHGRRADITQIIDVSAGLPSV